MLILTVFDFEIFYCLNKINSTNKSSKRLNYKKVSLNKTTLLLTLQNKLMLLIIRILSISIMQNKRESLYINFLLLILTLNVVVIVNKTLFSNI